MLQITFYNLSKKVNSTKQPNVPGEIVDCVLKTPASITAPVVEIKIDAIPAWNYAYIPDMGRYYFVTGTAYNRGIWEISLSVDVLASFKSEIGNTSMYVLRSSARKNGTIIDNLYPLTGDHSINHTQVKALTSYNSGTIILNLANGDANSGTCSYAFTVANFGEFLDQIMIDGDKQTAEYDPIAQAVNVNLFDPIRFVNSAYWFPGAITEYIYTAATPKLQLKLGNFVASGFQCYPVFHSVSNQTKTYTVSIPKHPQASTRGMYCNMTPFSEYTLSLGPFGALNLDSAVLAESSSITIKVYQDVNTGSGRCTIYTNDGAIVANVSTQWGVPLRIFQSTPTSGVMGMFGSLAHAAVGLVTGEMSTAAGGLASSISSVGNIVKGTLSSTGSNGAVLDHMMEWYLDAKFYYIADDNNADNGRPLCEIYKPSALGGFMQVQHGIVESSMATRPELDSVNTYCEGGFYYE